jgi:hypothetical protein
MHSVSAGALGGGEQLLDIEIAVGGRRSAEGHSKISRQRMRGALISI